MKHLKSPIATGFSSGHKEFSNKCTFCLDEMLPNGSVAVETDGNSTGKEGNPFRKETEKSPPSGHGSRKSSGTEKAGSTEEKPSVKEELRTIRENRNSTGREKRSPKQRTGKWKSGKAKRGR